MATRIYPFNPSINAVQVLTYCERVHRREKKDKPIVHIFVRKT
jgi:hypothetical protein